MNREQAINAANEAEEAGLVGLYPMAAQTLRDELLELTRQNTEQVKLLAVMREALKTYQCAGFGNSIDIVLHSIAYRLGTKALSATSETVGKYLDEVRADERKLRRMLCACYAGAAAYMDDGEAQDSSQTPIIDFMRFTPEQIKQAMIERARAELRAGKGGECDG